VSVDISAPKKGACSRGRYHGNEEDASLLRRETCRNYSKRRLSSDVVEISLVTGGRPEKGTKRGSEKRT